MRTIQEKDLAFVAALEALYEKHPLPDHPRRALWQRERHLTLQWASIGSYAYWGVMPLGTIKVPPDELRTVHTLIYG